MTTADRLHLVLPDNRPLPLTYQFAQPDFWRLQPWRDSRPAHAGYESGKFVQLQEDHYQPLKILFLDLTTVLSSTSERA